MADEISLDSYLSGDETTQPRELAYGVLREPPAPSFDHQVVMGRIYVRLESHVRRQKAGRVVPSPVDVILDPARALVVQPDVVFVSTARRAICTDRIWGAPDLVVEVLSPGTWRHDRIEKIEWYRHYGVGECWLVDPIARQVEVVDCSTQIAPPCVFGERQTIRSRVLPRLRVRPSAFFSDPADAY